jgi:acylglycerol lipase
MTGWIRQIAAVVLLIGLTAACSPTIMEQGAPIQSASIQSDAFVMPDGMRLPLHSWGPEEDQPKAVIIALHGFNDYGQFFEQLGEYLSTRGIVSYAYDQRGFGGTNDAGYWAGVDTYISDARSVFAIVKARFPETPVYMFGESMGGAVLMTAAVGDDPIKAEGFILAAPAVWGRSTMPFYQRVALWLAARIVPWMHLSGQGLNITPSDNVEMLRALGRDPLVIKETRVDAIWGLVNLMDRALVDANRFDARALILYGERDEIIAMGPTRKMLDSLPDTDGNQRRIALYETGYHMLIRDLMAETIWRDVESWITAPQVSLPSGADNYATRIHNSSDP